MLAHHKVSTQAQQDLPVVMIDAVLIEQVLTNLLENAAKYTPKGSIITLSVMRQDSDILVSVADNGPGIPPGTEQKVFDKFYTAGQKGTGLGLAICYGIITAHKGRIWAQNKPDGGAMFSFTLPAENLHAPQVTAADEKTR